MITANKILIIGPAWVGDMVMAQTLFALLKQRRPEAQIDVMAPAWSQPLLARMPEVHKGLVSPFQHGQLRLKERWQLGKDLRAEQYDQAILLPNSLKSAIVPYAARIPRRTGWLGEYRWRLLNDVRYLNKQQLPLMIQRFAALGLPKHSAVPDKLPSPHLKTDEANVQKAVQRLSLAVGERPILALCPGAEFGPSKRWPEHYYAEFARAKINEGWQVWIFGSKNDRAVGDAIQQQAPEHCYNLAGETSLAEAVDLLSLADLVLTNDSGLMHIAAALNRRLIAVYGSTSPDFTPPLNPQAKIIRASISCSPCFKRECPLQHHRCMIDTAPDQVLQQAQQMTSSTKSHTDVHA